MNFYESIIFYLVLGLATAVAYRAVDRTTGRVQRLAGLVAAWLFWPLYVPLVLANRGSASPPSSSIVAPTDDLAGAIEQVQRELDAALAGLDGWAENVLSRNSTRLRELRTALIARAERIREMEAVLERERQTPPPADVAEPSPTAAENESEAGRRRLRSRQARQENMDRLADVCRRARTDMLATFAWIRELVSMIHLAKFTGAPADRAEELIAQIAAAVESLSAESAAAEASRREPSRLPVVLQAGEEKAGGRDDAEQQDAQRNVTSF
jgi:hypothetical protein